MAVPAIALLLSMSVDRRQQAERAVTQSAERLAGLKAVHQERLVEGTRQLLIAVSQSRDVREGDSETCSNGKASLPFAYPLLDEQGHVRLVVFAALALERFNEGLHDDWPADATLIVTDRSHTIVAMHPDGRKWVGQSLKNDAVTQRIGSALQKPFTPDRLAKKILEVLG